MTVMTSALPMRLSEPRLNRIAMRKNAAAVPIGTHGDRVNRTLNSNPYAMLPKMKSSSVSMGPARQSTRHTASATPKKMVTSASL